MIFPMRLEPHILIRCGSRFALSREDELELLAIYDKGGRDAKKPALARRFNIHPNTVRNIILRHKNAPGPHETSGHDLDLSETSGPSLNPEDTSDLTVPPMAA